MNPALRLVSTLPTATEIVYELGLGQALLAVSHECNYPAAARLLPRVTSVNFDYAAAPSQAIDTHVKTALHQNRSLYRLNQTLLRRLKPTHLLTQELCDVCALTPTDVQKAIHDLPERPEVISLKASGLADICSDILRLADLLSQPTAGHGLATRLNQILRTYRAQASRLPRRTVFCLEWLEPLYTTGHWVPEMIELAGGHDVIARAHDRSHKLSWSDIAAADPEILILMPCGFPLPKTLAELPRLQSHPEWPKLRAVKTGQVWLVDAPAYFSQSGPRVITEGIPLLARILHPRVFGPPNPTTAIHI
jgi:iron complex transport system substrate-binding protein